MQPPLWATLWTHQEEFHNRNSHTRGRAIVTLSSVLLKKTPHSTTLNPPSASTSPHFPVAVTGGSWGFWVNKTQQLHKRAPLGSFWLVVASQACRWAWGPAPTFADDLKDPQVVDWKTADIQLLCNKELRWNVWNCAFSVLGGAAYLANFHTFHPKPKPGQQENLVFCLVNWHANTQEVPLNLSEFLVSWHSTSYYKFL